MKGKKDLFQHKNITVLYFICNGCSINEVKKKKKGKEELSSQTFLQHTIMHTFNDHAFCPSLSTQYIIKKKHYTCLLAHLEF